LVWLDERARKVIETESSARRFLETGGPMFGWGEGEDLVVACAYGPGPLAVHGSHSYVPDRAETERLITRTHTQTAGRYRYLGSWHSHPDADAFPSPQDKETARRTAGQATVKLDRPLLVIQAIASAKRFVRLVGLAAYRWNPANLRLEEVEITDYCLLTRLCSEDRA
jgi:integrative and conjugative element protein (TIGR02256 family)